MINHHLKKDDSLDSSYTACSLLLHIVSSLGKKALFLYKGANKYQKADFFIYLPGSIFSHFSSGEECGLIPRTVESSLLPLCLSLLPDTFKAASNFHFAPLPRPGKLALLLCNA